MINNLILRKGMAFLLIVTLILSGFFISPNQVQALTIEKTVTKYHLDIGVQQIWGVFTGEYDANGKEIVDWDDNIGPNGSMDVDTSIPFFKAVSNVKAYQYSDSKFNWDDTEHYSSNVGSESYYKNNYSKFASNYISVTSYNSSGKTVSFSYSASMNSKMEYDLAQALGQLKINEVFRLMAGPNSSNPEGDVKKNFPSLYSKLNAGRNGVDSKVRAYMYFTPVIIQYDVKEMVEVGAIDAGLTLSATAKAGESYSAADNSYVEDILTLTDAVLQKRIDGGEWQPVTVWEGTGQKGKNTGGSITEMSEEICTITYRLTITASDGQTDTAEKSITITDGREIEGKAILELDKYTYEGHPADAEDWSEFTVDGVRYSAKRAYEEKIASNKFRTESGTVKKDGYDAIVTYPKKGTYPVNLEVTLKATGHKLTDTKTIEVRKTPYVIDSLGGFQKQNRKQVLTFNVATYPDKPLVDYDITIKDLKSNELISLTKVVPQENGACIKTRTVKSEVKDQYWTTLTVEFLTKYPRYDLTGDASQSFSYKIKVTDSKGDSDEAYKEFDVVPDKPPIAAINMQTSFLRAEGTNTARLEAADGSQSDGDQLLRTWSIVNHNPLDNKMVGDFVNATTVNGYENLAFGTNQTIGWNKEGVGKTTVKLHVKDIWVESTLEEYIVPSDYLEAETTAGTEVINIAPKVSIEPLETLKANIAILVKRNQYDSLKNKTNELNAALIEKGLDGNVSIIPVSETSEGGESSSLSIENAGATGGARISDSKYVYVIAPDNTANGVKIQAVNEKGKTAWSYPVSESNYYHKLYIDNQEKYLVYSFGNDSTADNTGKYTLLFDSKTGALLTRIDGISFRSDAKVFLSNDGKRLYSADSKGIQRLDFKTGKLSAVVNTELFAPRIEKGKLGFIGKMADAKYYIGRFDLTSELTDKTALPTLNYKNPINDEGMTGISPADWDADGKVMVVRRLYEAYDGACGGEVWLLDSKTQTQNHVWKSIGDDKGWNAFLIKDKDGIADYFGISYGHQGTSKYYNDVELYKIEEKENLTSTPIAHWDSGKTGSIKLANAGYYDRDNNLVYMAGLEYYGKAWIYNLNTGEWDSASASIAVLGLDSITGKIELHDGKMVNMYYGSEFSSLPMYYITQSTLPITAEQSAYNGILKRGEFESNAENYIVNMGIEESMDKVEGYALEQGAVKLDMAAEERIADIAERIKELGKQAKYKLSLIGDGAANAASVIKNIALDGNTEYEYSYDRQAVSGSAIDAFHMEKNQTETVNGKPIYKEIVYQADLTNGANSYITDGFVSYDNGSWFNGSKYGEAGYGGGPISKNSNSGGPTISFTLEKDGYIELDMANDCYENYGRGRTLKVDGRLVAAQRDDDLDYGQRKTTFFIFLKAGKHTISGGANKSEVHNVMKAMEIGYLSDQDNSLTKQTVSSSSEGTVQRITGKFTAPKAIAYSEQQSVNLRTLNLWDLQNSGNLSLGACSNGWCNISADGSAAWSHCDHRSGKNGVLVVCNVQIKAPTDKMLWISYNQDSRLLSPSETYTARYEQKGDNRDYTAITDFKAVEIPLGTLGVTTASAISFGDNTPCIKYTVSNEKSNSFYKMDFNSGTAVMTKCQTGYSPDISGKLSLTTQGSSNLVNLLISDFTLKAVYSKLNVKGTVYENRFNNTFSLNNWQIQNKGAGRAEMKLSEPAKKEEDAPLVYRKGQLIKYNIYYSDYEGDSSKSGYWLYAHTPYNDGEHPDAAIVYDEDGNIKSICGEAVTPGAITIDDALNIAKAKGLKILDNSIDRFYVDGKYVVYHWEYDDTSRGLISGGYPTYNKVSNTADLIFYIEGGASAPWITGISTSPAKVNENNYFSINVGIDDNEKDILNLTTEVYKDRKHIFTHRKKNIWPVDASGNPTTNSAIAVGYPVTNTGALPDKAQAGTYEVVCTVRDHTGAGIGTYRFIVVSEGRITGAVYHIEQWDINRKKYNLNRFKDEINKVIPYAEYMKLKEPRTRGTNVFWSGEKFMLNAAVASTPTKVKCSINGTSYKTTMENGGKKNAAGETIYTGSIWDRAMINKWGRKVPEELTFTFTAEYSSGIIKKHEVKVIVDNIDDYWKLHRVF
ncbi:hypothetical protein [Aminipila sp.]|uniref:hypothetical protein n=1 Tax=Aminipila sp. TaxID=2060095 RepID=UPI0028967FAB|nr:hypothetical protein [Aminipila sp.]